MSINEVFPNPTVKQVIFQIKFPNLFSIENKIGDIQLEIMKEFPESAQLFRKHVVFTDLGPEAKAEDFRLNEDITRKIWQFKSKNNCVLNILTNSLDISSNFHKTYNNPNSEYKFRDTIQFVLDTFIRITKIPVINRIGLRYIDECPIKSLSNRSFKSYYNTTFPLNRFAIENAVEMDFKARVRKDNYFIQYIESLQINEDKYNLVLDFDGYAENLEPSNYLKVTDDLHDLILSEYENTIKQPVYDYMKKEKVDKHGV